MSFSDFKVDEKPFVRYNICGRSRCFLCKRSENLLREMLLAAKGLAEMRNSNCVRLSLFVGNFNGGKTAAVVVTVVNTFVYVAYNCRIIHRYTPPCVCCKYVQNYSLLFTESSFLFGKWKNFFQSFRRLHFLHKIMDFFNLWTLCHELRYL